MDNLSENKGAAEEEKKADDQSKSKCESELDFDWLFDGNSKKKGHNSMVAGTAVTRDYSGAEIEGTFKTAGDTATTNVTDAIAGEHIIDGASEFPTEGTGEVMGEIASTVVDGVVDLVGGLIEGIFS